MLRRCTTLRLAHSPLRRGDSTPIAGDVASLTENITPLHAHTWLIGHRSTMLGAEQGQRRRQIVPSRAQSTPIAVQFVIARAPMRRLDERIGAIRDGIDDSR